MTNISYIDMRPAIFAIIGLVCASSASAQTPVIGPGATAFDPEISFVNSGAVIAPQATVSADMRYVTITMGAQNANLINMRTFPVQAVTGDGFVGGGNPGGGNPGHIGDGNYLAINPTADQRNDPLILNRRGIIRLSPR